MAFYCPCLDECGELCDDCFDGFAQRHKLVELGPDGRPLYDDSPYPSGPVYSDEEMEDLELEGPSEEGGDFQLPALTRSTASVSRNFRGHQYEDAEEDVGRGPGGAAPRPPAAGPVSLSRNDDARDPYGDYLKRQKIAKK